MKWKQGSCLFQKNIVIRLEKKTSQECQLLHSPKICSTFKQEYEYKRAVHVYACVYMCVPVSAHVCAHVCT